MLFALALIHSIAKRYPELIGRLCFRQMLCATRNWEIAVITGIARDRRDRESVIHGQPEQVG